MGPCRSSVPIAILMLSILALSSALDISVASRTDEEVKAIYDGWFAKQGRAYNAVGEKHRRFQIFKDNLQFIDAHNSDPNRTYTLGLTRFADLTNDEYRSRYLGSKPPAGRPKKVSSRYTSRVGDDLPDSVDWRTSGAVGDVRNQGNCAAVEGINQIVTGDFISLSVQELVDCNVGYNEGCNGGLMDFAFEFIINNGGIDTDDDYPYIGHDGTCDLNKKNAKVVTIDSYEDVPMNDEKALKKAVANQPVAVAIEAGGRDFQLYVSGVFTGACGTDLDHAAVVVGYGTESGKDYWIVRDSRGAQWGEHGYIRMERNVAGAEGKCGIAMLPSYPIKKGQNPPKPGPTPPSPVKPPSVCDNYYSCPNGNTCCCVVQGGGYCHQWSCCPLEGAICCADGYSCCPSDHPVCNSRAGTCSKSKNNPLGGKESKRTLAQPSWALITGGFRSSV